MIGFIKTILIIMFFYYLFKIVARIAAPFLMRYAAKKMQDKFKQQMRGQGGFDFGNKQKSSVKEGEVHLKSKPKNSQNANTDSVGEYVDFEEVE